MSTRTPRHPYTFFLFLVLWCSSVWCPLVYAKLENFQAADGVIGQPDFTSNTANNGGRSARSLSLQRYLFTDGKRLFVADRSNHRVLIWNSIPETNFAPSDLVLGQPDFTSGTANNGGRSAATLNTPHDVFFDGQRLFVADDLNHRILIWNSLPAANFAAADVVLGQPDFTSGTLNNGGRSASTMNRPEGVFSDRKRLIVSDGVNHRVLIWNSIPTSNSVPADVVLGQPDFASGTANNGGRSAATMNFPDTISSDGKRFFVADSVNNRVLIWNSIPTANFIPADVVLGQPDFTTGTANSGGRSARTCNSLRAVWTDGKRLIAGDELNHRVLIWNSIPTTNFAPADVVLGQPDFSSATANNEGISARTLNRPRGGVSDGKRLFVSDDSNNRVLLFNIAGSSIQLGPQFNQGKAVVGKVFEDWNGNGVQDDSPVIARSPEATKQSPEIATAPSEPRDASRIASASSGTPPRNDGLLEESGIEGVKVVSDTGIYAITDSDGKYHFPYIETGQRILKLDPSTLPEGAMITTESPRKVVVTKGILTKVSFGVRLPAEDTVIASKAKQSQNPGIASASSGTLPRNDTNLPLLKVSISQDPTLLKPRLSISAEQKKDKILFTIDCNYFLFIERSDLTVFDEDLRPIKTFPLSQPLPLNYELSLKELPLSFKEEPQTIHYQLTVYDKQGKEDRTGVGMIRLGE